MIQAGSRSDDTRAKDVLIVGAGPSGLSLACALAASGLEIAVIDKQPLAQIAEPAMDGRDIAMTHLSKTILAEMGVWQRFSKEEIHPLEQATVQNGSSPYALHFEPNASSDSALDFDSGFDPASGSNSNLPLGYLVANCAIRRALFQEVQTHQNIELLLEQEVSAVSSDDIRAQLLLADGECLSAPLVVAADSRFSATRRMMGIGAKMRDYGRVMIVCNMRHSLSHERKAQECFHYGRTCAILPLAEGQSSIVITVAAARAGELIGLSPEDFRQQVMAMLDARLGDMELISERFSYPLVGAYADRFVAQRFALVGDAAVGMHPVTAHGYNLALRSVDTLASQIIKAQKAGRDIGSSWVLQHYQLRHRLLAKPLYESTNAIVRLFTDDKSLAKLARKVALRVGNNLAPFKSLLSNRLTQIR